MNLFVNTAIRYIFSQGYSLYFFLSFDYFYGGLRVGVLGLGSWAIMGGDFS